MFIRASNWGCTSGFHSGFDLTGNKTGAGTSSHWKASNGEFDRSTKAGPIEELPRLKRFCLSLTSDPSDADDLLQITVERLLEKGMPHDAHVASGRIGSAETFGLMIRSEMANRWRNPNREGAGTSANSDDSVQLDRVSAAMDRLPTEQRAAVRWLWRVALTPKRRCWKSRSAPSGSGREGEKSVGRRFEWSAEEA